MRQKQQRSCWGNRMNQRCNLRRLIVFALLSFGWMVVIFLFSGQNGELSGELSQGFLSSLLQFFRIDSDSMLAETLSHLHLVLRKGAHFCVYTVLAVLLGNAFLALPWKKRYQALLTIGISALYACSDEFHQYFVPGRAASLWDVGIDTLGAVLGMSFAYLVPYIVRSCRNEIKCHTKKSF